jgi:hypothetical protein
MPIVKIGGSLLALRGNMGVARWPDTDVGLWSSPPQTEDSAESGYVDRDEHTGNPVSYRNLGMSDSIDLDDVGDIADEGPGHRG